jgi:hypothetical protein
MGTGDQTFFGRIAGLSNGRRTEMIPMQKEILRFVLIIVCFVVVFVLIIVIVWYAKVYSIGNMRILNVALLGLLTCTKTTPIPSTFQRLSSAVSVWELPLSPRVFLYPDFVVQVANEASSIYFINLVFKQFFNLLA